MEDTSPTISVPNEPLFKFLTSEMRSPTGTGKWTVNRWRSVRGVIVPCENGLHATTAANLLPFVSNTLWRVEIGDEYVWHGSAGTTDHKLVARRMRLVERIEAWNEQTMRLFAADCAERVLPLFEVRYPEDKRPREAIDVARRYARGEATREELIAAAANAYAAANAAAYTVEREWQNRHFAMMLGLPALRGEASDADAE